MTGSFDPLSPAAHSARAYTIAFRRLGGPAAAFDPEDRVWRDLGRLYAKHQGRVLVADAPAKRPLGPAPEARLTVVEYRDATQVREFLDDPDARDAIAALAALGSASLWAVEGISPPSQPLATSDGRHVYGLARLELLDPARLSLYRDLIGRLLAAYGGRYLVRVQRPETLAGPQQDVHLTLMEFESAEHLMRAATSKDLRDLAVLQTGIGNVEYWFAGGTSAGGDG